MVHPSDEPALIVRARSGDDASFGELVERHQQVVFRAAYAVLRDGGHAEDIAQETFVRAHRELSRFDEQRPLRPWLIRVATNLALNEQRRQKRGTALLERLWRLTPRRDARLLPAR